MVQLMAIEVDASRFRFQVRIAEREVDAGHNPNGDARVESADTTITRIPEVAPL